MHAWPMRPHDDVALPGRGVIEHRWQLILQFGGRYIAAKHFFVAGARRPCDIEMRGADAGENIEHPLSVLMCSVLSHRPAVSLVTCETTPAIEYFPACASRL